MEISPLSFRKEVLEYLTSCENLLALMSTPNTSLFSKDELDVLQYSVVELHKVLEICDDRLGQADQVLLSFSTPLVG
jgi:hypothetical protein